jgi:uncharacterized protein (TIGR01777 family)
MKAEVVERSGTNRPGDWVRLHASVAGPVGFDWTVVHEDLPERDALGFADVQLSGPFRAWRHEHRYLPRAEDASQLEDRLVYELRAGALGRGIAGEWVTSILDRMFELRHLRTWNDLVRMQDAGFQRPLKVAVTGASGLIGRRLVPFLQGGGHEVFSLVRRNLEGDHQIHWNPATGEIDALSLEGIDAVVHLAGVSIAGGRWSASRKEAILRSRVDGTRLLAKTVAQLQSPPAVLVSTSAVGFYGDTGDRTVTEESPAGSGFLADVCVQWEAAADPAREAGIRVVHPRFGVVFAGDGGMLPLIALPFKAGVGGKLGNGQQGMPWIGLEDLIGVLLTSIADERLAGPVNAVSPEPTTNAEFTRAMGKVLGRPTILPVPAAPMKQAGGELAESLILASQHVAPARLESVGFQFAFPSLVDTLRIELGKPGLQPGVNRLPLSTALAV